MEISEGRDHGGTSQFMRKKQIVPSTITDLVCQSETEIGIRSHRNGWMSKDGSFTINLSNYTLPKTLEISVYEKNKKYTMVTCSRPYMITYDRISLVERALWIPHW